MSLPILLGWGLPISVVSWFATPLFAPLFSLFLLCCTIIFFGYFLYMPTWPVVWLMEKICALWLLILSWYKHWWLIGFCVPHPILLCIVPCAILAIMHYKYYVHSLQRIVYMSMVIIGYCTALKMYQHMQEPIITSIPCNGSTLLIISTYDKTICIDNGCLAKKIPNNAWIEYELLPTITKKTGKTYITHFICLQCSVRSLEFIKLLHKNRPLSLAVIPDLQETSNSSYALTLQEIKKILLNNSTGKHSLKMVGKNNALTLPITNTLSLVINNIHQDVASKGKTFLSLQMYNATGHTVLESKALKSKNLT